MSKTTNTDKAFSAAQEIHMESFYRSVKKMPVLAIPDIAEIITKYFPTKAVKPVVLDKAGD